MTILSIPVDSYGQVEPRAKERLELAIMHPATEWLTEYEVGCDVCESPIERLLWLEFLAHSIETNGGLLVCADGDVECFPPVDDRVSVYLQHQVGPYRADFLVVSKIAGHERMIVVECDGHDYHERTKKQAQRDKQRDRWMTANGYTVLRFTGSEIWADAAACEHEVWKLARGRMSHEQN